jgi:competence protein ComEA
MRLHTLAATTLLGAMLALPALAQTTTTAPATTPAAKPPMTMPHMTTAPAAMAAPVNINTATAAQLDKLPQIGKARSAKIIAGRPYKSVDELDSKKVVPHSVFLKIKDKVAV